MATPGAVEMDLDAESQFNVSSEPKSSRRSVSYTPNLLEKIAIKMIFASVLQATSPTSRFASTNQAPVIQWNPSSGTCMTCGIYTFTPA
jgi:hypothetical protein